MKKNDFLSKTLALCDPGGRRDDNADAEIPADMGRGRQRAQEKITRKGEPLTLMTAIITRGTAFQFRILNSDGTHVPDRTHVPK